MSNAPNVLYTDVLKDIEDFYVESGVDVYIPVLDKSLKFKPLSVSQLKRFIELQVKVSKDETGILPGLDMVNHLNQLLIENYIGKDADGLLQRLTILDRDSIVAQLRAANNPAVEVQTDGDDTEEVCIEHILTESKNCKLSAKCKKRTCVIKFKTGHIKLKLKIPTLYDDSYINTYFKRQVGPFLKKGAKGLEKNLERILSQTYLVELCKYIDVLEIEKNDNSTTVTFDNVETLTQQLKLLEQLPSSVIVQVNGFIKDVKQYRDSILYYINDDGKHKPLSVDVSLFTTI